MCNGNNSCVALWGTIDFIVYSDWLNEHFQSIIILHYILIVVVNHHTLSLETPSSTIDNSINILSKLRKKRINNIFSHIFKILHSSVINFSKKCNQSSFRSNWLFHFIFHYFRKRATLCRSNGHVFILSKIRLWKISRMGQIWLS